MVKHKKLYRSDSSPEGFGVVSRGFSPANHSAMSAGEEDETVQPPSADYKNK
jgi:hypothetical protein